jgi:hypothetical protein
LTGCAGLTRGVAKNSEGHPPAWPWIDEKAGCKFFSTDLKFYILILKNYKI